VLRSVSPYVQMGLSGLLIGSFLGGIILRSSLNGTGIYALAGLLLSGGLLAWLGQRYQRFRRAIHAGLAGILPGMLLGGHLYAWMGYSHLGILLGTLWGVVWFAAGWAFVISCLQKAGWYVAYRGETSVFFLLSLLGAWLGFELATAITAKETWLQAVLYFTLPFLVAGFFALLPGIIFSRNHNRPLFASLLGILSGGLVLWVGINVAPLLFLPGSGLMWAGMVIGALMLVVSVLPLIYPKFSLVLGGLLIFFSILSFVGATGGLIVGGLLGILSGSLIASWQGAAGQPQIVQEVDESKEKQAEEKVGGGKAIREVAVSQEADSPELDAQRATEK